MQSQHLKVVFYLRSPIVVPDHPIHLDAVLAWAAVKRTGSLSAQDNLPLERYGEEDRWVWKASWLDFVDVVQRWQVDYIRRFDLWGRMEDFRRGVIQNWRVIARGTGVDKAYSMSVMVMRALRAEAYCIGDRAQVEDLLSEVTHLGRLRRLGYGEIEKAEVMSVEDSADRWRLRIMPDDGEGYAKVWACLRPPYWERSNRVEAYWPISIC